MNDKLSKRDWEIISAYLDGQISKKDLARFESRLAREPELQNALQEMRTTRQILRSAPRLLAPRNFTLTPEMVRKVIPPPPRRKPRLAPFFGWATTAVSLLLVLVLVGDFISFGSAKSIAMDAAPPQAPMQDIALEVAFTAPAASPEVFEAPASEGVSEPQPEIEAPAAAPEVAAAPTQEPTVASEKIFSPAAPAPTETLTEITAGNESPESVQSDEAVTATLLQPGAALTATEEIVAETEVTPTLALTAADAASEPPVEESAAEEAAQPVLVTVPAPEREALGEEDAAPVDGGANAEPEVRATQGRPAPAETVAPQPFTLLRIMEFFLLLVALGTGVIWLYLRRRGI